MAESAAGTQSARQGYFERAKKVRARIEKALALPGELSIISLVDDLVSYSYLSSASDIHIDPTEDSIRVRLRIDGVLHDAFALPKRIHSEVVTRLKVLSGLRTDEHQAAQDGRFQTKISGDGAVDIRVSIAPTFYGENCVMRILAEQAETFTLETLGFSEANLKKVEKAIKKPYGMILITGPTGSGKTTTLYSILRRLNTEEVSIVTIEDPIEYSLQGIDQVQVNPKTGMTFAQGLRFILRQDPNIILVGEIRDNETAGIAINAAMTGHLLLSTLHANDAPTALPRLLEMDVEPFLITSTVNIIMSQRLVRLICPECKTEKELSETEVQSLREFIPESVLDNNRKFYIGRGCDGCGETGYRGRMGIHEVLEMTDTIRELVMKKANADEVREAAAREGMASMLEDGFQKALVGQTTIEEVLRVFRE